MPTRDGTSRKDEERKGDGIDESAEERWKEGSRPEISVYLSNS
jgi:hypothetical protein